MGQILGNFQIRMIQCVHLDWYISMDIKRWLDWPFKQYFYIGISKNCLFLWASVTCNYHVIINMRDIRKVRSVSTWKKPSVCQLHIIGIFMLSVQLWQREYSCINMNNFMSVNILLNNIWWLFPRKGNYITAQVIYNIQYPDIWDSG